MGSSWQSGGSDSCELSPRFLQTDTAVPIPLVVVVNIYKGKVHKKKRRKKLIKISFRYVRVTEKFEKFVCFPFFPNIL